MPEDHFGESVAQHYDESAADTLGPGSTEKAVEVLAELAGAGPVLELGIGTGRIALPLSQRGLAVHGIDLSTAMIAKLQEKPGAQAIAVTVGDFATTKVDGTFSLAYLVFNTIMNLTTQDEQVACFGNVASHLQSGGCFVVEVSVPRLQQLPVGQRIVPFTVTPTRLGFDEYEVATQSLVSHHYRVNDGTLDASSIPFRYVWPSELDLMARMAGMRLRHRWSGWQRKPFTSHSHKHVSVWEKEPA